MPEGDISDYELELELELDFLQTVKLHQPWEILRTDLVVGGNTAHRANLSKVTVLRAKSDKVEANQIRLGPRFRLHVAWLF